MEKYKKALQQIEKEWTGFMESERFFDEAENRAEKTKMKVLIEEIAADQSLLEGQKKEIINQCIQLLGEHTGCSEDLVLSDEIMDELMDKNILKEESYDVFLSNSPIKRWL